MTSTFTRGLLAGAAGSALLTAAGYADMALTGRPASTVPGRAVAELLRRTGRPVPDDSRLRALGELSGIGTGLTIAVVVSALRGAGVRLPARVGAPAIGALAMAATDVSYARLGVSDPRAWTRAEWVRDVVPHLAYGIGVHATLAAPERRRPHLSTGTGTGVGTEGVDSLEEDGRHPGGRGLLGRSLVLGLAAGGRSSLGYLAAARLAHRKAVTVGATAAMAAEFVADKLPATPNRLLPGPLAGRAAAGAVGGLALARHAGRPVLAPAAVGLVGAVLGSILGAAWRDVAQARGWVIQGAVAEDLVALAMAWAALRQPA
jgi:uncharacterized membrane protein